MQRGCSKLLATMRNGVRLNLKTTPRNYGFLKQIISADDAVSDAFRWHTRQNEGVTGTYSEYHDLQTSTGGSCVCNQAQQEKGTFQRFEIYKHDSARQWHKREQQNFVPPAPRPNSKEVVTGPCALKTAPRALLYLWTLGLSCHQKSYFKQAKYRQSDKPK